MKPRILNNVPLRLRRSDLGRLSGGAHHDVTSGNPVANESTILLESLRRRCARQLNQEQEISALLQFWFGELDGDGLCSREHQKRWFSPPEGTDETIRRQFGPTVAQALEGRLDNWSHSATGRIALVILLDQFTRNIYRGTPRAFAGDARALGFARQAVQKDGFAVLPLIHRVFLCVPFEHAENLAAQDEGIQSMDAILEGCPKSARPLVENFRRYMLAHREVIDRFGRFPHRNAILGRESTPEELAWLETHGGF